MESTDEPGDTVDTELFTRVVRHGLPDVTVETVTPGGPSWNPVTEVARVGFADRDPVYCKAAPGDHEGDLRAEAGTLDYVGATLRVRVPSVVRVTTEPVAALLTEPVAGRAVADEWFETTPERRATLAERLGRTLATVHTERFDRAGEITGGDPDGLALDHAPWPEVLRAGVTETQRRAPTDRFDPECARLLDAIDDSRDRLADPPARLLHRDPATPNCFDTGDDRLTLLDWGNSVVGDPVCDLVRAREQVLAPSREPAPDRLVAPLRRGYRAVAGGVPSAADREPVYEAAITLSTAGFVDRLAEWREESVAELTAWFRAELDGRLSAVE
ncbi:MAG: putative aminoglycoside phosphotransferase [halophilic archaeon J07HB67]|nr:MAG: putative aminoglycoside phosphotransferase [halophilic archaeon J07HB67]